MEDKKRAFMDSVSKKWDVKRLRDQCKMTQAEFSAEFGMSKRTVEQWEAEGCKRWMYEILDDCVRYRLEYGFITKQMPLEM